MNRKQKMTTRLHPAVIQYLNLIADELETTTSSLVRSVLTDYVAMIRQETQYLYDEEIPALN